MNHLITNEKSRSYQERTIAHMECSQDCSYEFGGSALGIKKGKYKIKMYFFKRAMFYLYFLKDNYKVPYICGTPKCENDYRIHEEPPPNTKSKMT